jgi:hypothetical protein
MTDFQKNQKMLIDDMLRVIKECKHENTIDLGDEEHGVIACINCESVSTRKLLREQEEEK